ncbi:sensor histidine kinase [Streptomyces sp. NPDC020917]|uniref:sensor histidine kinase n=1 Tax=Streptomyces sp. NPDC020917 TaxID=3365102 RepID=UPI00379BA261
MPSVTRLRAIAARKRAELLVTAVLWGWALADVPWPWRPPGHGGTAAAVCGFLALALVQSVPSLWRRRLPVVGLALACGALALRTAYGLHLASGLVAVAATAYAVGAYSDVPRRLARPLLAGAAVVAVAAMVNYHVRMAFGLPGVLLVAGLLAGDAAASRRWAASAAVEAARDAERVRIARELHDVLAHQLSAITVRAGAARMAASTTGSTRFQGASGVEAFGAIEGLAREALNELGHLLGVLRREPEETPRRPAPCLAEVPSLISTVRSAGVAAEMTVVGPMRPLSPGAELTIFRIVQEALTNVVKHAPGAAAEVELRFQSRELVLSVVNGAAKGVRSGRVPTTGGLGMLGMRERARLHGGHLTAAALPDGGFAVHARLPYGPTGGTR